MPFEDAKSYKNKIKELKELQQQATRDLGIVLETAENTKREIQLTREENKKIANQIMENKKELEEINKRIEKQKEIEIQAIKDASDKIAKIDVVGEDMKYKMKELDYIYLNRQKEIENLEARIKTLKNEDEKITESVNLINRVYSELFNERNILQNEIKSLSSELKKAIETINSVDGRIKSLKEFEERLSIYERRIKKYYKFIGKELPLI